MVGHPWEGPRAIDKRSSASKWAQSVRVHDKGEQEETSSALLSMPRLDPTHNRVEDVCAESCAPGDEVEPLHGERRQCRLCKSCHGWCDCRVQLLDRNVRYAIALEE